ncbi:MAG: pentapeptide repeat-containing protein [Chloroflexi bacterium]|nr:pentapeptide repeat-containing protein [Chloroflexota bacterium]
MSTIAKNKIEKFIIFSLLVLALSVILSFFWKPPAAFAGTQPESMNQQELQNEKTRHEIQKLQLENERSNSFWGILPSYATFITALVAIIGVIITIWKQIYEWSRQKELDRAQRELESKRRSDDKFSSVITSLGSDSPSIQASAAVSIMSFLKPEYKDFYDQVFLILLANLKIQQEDAVNRLLIKGFEKAIRFHLESAKEKGEQEGLDLSHMYLNRVDLSGLDLSNTDFGFARLRHANFDGANLYRARGIEADLKKGRLCRANFNEARFQKAQIPGAQFHGSNLVASDLKEANLFEAQFHQAKMQSAHLDGADLRRAKFEQADLNDTFFKGAKFDRVSLKSILNAINWQKAHFDGNIKAELENLLSQGHPDQSKKQ